MAHDVFISHSAKDKTIGDAVCATLEANGIRCWIAPRDILPGADWGKSIIDAIASCRVMVLVFSSHANTSEHVKREVERAVNHGMPIIPLRIEDVMPEGALEYFLSSQHWLDAYTGEMAGHLARLGSVVQAVLQPSAGESFVAAKKPAPIAAQGSARTDVGVYGTGFGWGFIAAAKRNSAIWAIAAIAAIALFAFVNLQGQNSGNSSNIPAAPQDSSADQTLATAPVSTADAAAAAPAQRPENAFAASSPTPKSDASAGKLTEDDFWNVLGVTAESSLSDAIRVFGEPVPNDDPLEGNHFWATSNGCKWLNIVARTYIFYMPGCNRAVEPNSPIARLAALPRYKRASLLSGFKREPGWTDREVWASKHVKIYFMPDSIGVEWGMF